MKKSKVIYLMMLIELEKDRSLIPRKKYEIFLYHPWLSLWGGMTEQERVKKGIFIHCIGQGEFEVFELGKNVGIMPQCLYINYKKNGGPKYESAGKNS